MKLYGVLNTRGQRCLWALEEAGLPFEFQFVDFRAGDHRSPEYLAVNPNGKVPALEDGELKLFESAAICTYVGDKVPEKGLVPRPGTPERALYDQWMCFVIAELEQPLWTMGKHRFALPKEWRRPEMLEVARHEWTLAAGVLAKSLGERKFMVGDTFTMADILVTHTLQWARLFGVPLGHENLGRFADVMIERPAYARTGQYAR